MRGIWFRYKCFLLLVGLILCSISGLWAQQAYTVESLPSPKEAGQDFYVSNPDGILSEDAVVRLNAMAAAIEKVSGAEYAIVVLDDFEGDDIFEFALELFNHWGIGKKEGDNGLLLFIAKNRREYRFVSGYGMEGIFPDIYLHRIGEGHLVPHFKQGDYDEGVLEASRLVQQALNADDVLLELQQMMPEAAPFWRLENKSLRYCGLLVLLYVGLYVWVGYAGRRWASRVGVYLSSRHAGKRKKKGQKKGCRGWFFYVCFAGLGTLFTFLFVMMIFAFVLDDMGRLFQYTTLPYLFAIWGCYTLFFKISEERDIIKKSYKDEENRLKALRGFQRYAWIPFLCSPFLLFSVWRLKRAWADSRRRFTPPDDSGDWERLNRDVVKPKELKTYLSQGQLQEESLDSKYYEIWRNKRSAEQKVLGWVGKVKYAICPSCGFRTYEKGLRGQVLKRATYSSTGLQEVYDACVFCKHREEKGTRVTPKKVRSSGGGSSGSSSGGGSSSSSSGSFGGGSSGGGGAGGSW